MLIRLLFPSMLTVACCLPATPHEIFTPGSQHILAFSLADAPVHHPLSNGNVMMYSATFDVIIHESGGAPLVAHRQLADISFIPAHP